MKDLERFQRFFRYSAFCGFQVLMVFCYHLLIFTTTIEGFLEADEKQRELDFSTDVTTLLVSIKNFESVCENQLRGGGVSIDGRVV